MTHTLVHARASVTLYEDEFSRRIRMDDYSGDSGAVLELINQNIPAWAEKVILKIRAQDVAFFRSKGFQEEASIAGYFSGVDMHFLVRYIYDERSRSSRVADEDDIIKSVLLVPPAIASVPAVNVKFAGPDDAEDLARLYRDAFRVYPTPVYDPAHVRKTMEEGTVYVFIREGEKIVSAASAEINANYQNAELTDCATAEGHEGKGYMRALLTALENHLKHRNIRCLYTIARSSSFGMNKAFHQLGYTFGGRMTKNCMIYSGMEDMNVWYKFENSVI
jgi:putative beta-lysine N-acetyltransferase